MSEASMPNDTALTSNPPISTGSRRRFLSIGAQALASIAVAPLLATNAKAVPSDTSEESARKSTATTGAFACTRVLWNDNDFAVLSSRSLDWFAKQPERRAASEPKLHVMPRGIRKSGAMFGKELVVSENPAEWTSRYGSVVVSNLDNSIAEGMNEKGLAAHCLSLGASDYGKRDVSRQGIQMCLWVPYVLDNAATVEEAIALLPRIQPVSLTVDGFAMKLSLCIEDSTGDSAVIEYLNGSPVIHHGRQYRVLTNTVLEEALPLIRSYDFVNATRKLPLPGNNSSRDRFIRASYYSSFLSRLKPNTLLEAQAALMSVARNVSNPIGAPGDDIGSGDETDWRTLSDLTNRVYFFESCRGLTVLRTDLSRLDFSAGTGVRTLDPLNPNLQSDITGLYLPSSIPVPGVVTD